MDEVIWADTRALRCEVGKRGFSDQPTVGLGILWFVLQFKIGDGVDAHLRSSIGVNNGVPLKTGKTVNVTTLQGELG